ncbi:MAG: HDIG domain-containing protein [Desulfobacterales bacterium]
MNPIDLLAQYYDRQSKTFKILVEHGKQVAKKAQAAARQVSELKPDLEFIRNAAMLHDIGIFRTNSPGFGCYGKHPYICHGILGGELLSKAGHPKLALVCERHIGVGISIADIRHHNLPLPNRDMIPISIEEQLICYADKFFSKNSKAEPAEKSIPEIIANLKHYGPDKVKRFETWVKKFET